MRTWREWFVPPEDTDDPNDTPLSRVQELADLSGSGPILDEQFELKKRPVPRCVSCKKFMGYSSGMYIMIGDPWRLHISCFDRVVEKKFKDGEVIDLTTGAIVKLDPEAENDA